MYNLAHYVIALYIRLSIEDTKVESLSIENQKIALHKFVDTMEDICNIEAVEYIDNGYSGTNFERPAVQELLDAVRAGQINCIIVKDFSRFGRNSIEVGYFMERVFPLYGIRFISINDAYDSKDYQGDTGGMSVAFKYLAAEFYSRDLSVKSMSAKMVKMKRGEYQSKICLYGYKKSSDGRMEPDEETAPVVRLIFDLAAQGASSREIAKTLIARGIPTPGEYKTARGIGSHDVSRSAGQWQSSTIMRVLKDERYIGTYVIGKRQVLEIGSSHIRTKDESEWIKIPDHHQPLISKETFEKAQNSFTHFKCVKKNKAVFPLRHKVLCGCCQHFMCRSNGKDHYFFCNHTRYDDTAECHDLKISETELESMLYEMMSKQAQAILNVRNLSDADLLEVRLAEKADFGGRTEKIKEQKMALYERYILREISLVEYRQRKADIDKELERLEQAYAELSKQAAQMQMAQNTKNASRKLAEQIVNTGSLNANLTDAVIERVYVFPGNRIDVVWKMKDFFVEG